MSGLLLLGLGTALGALAPTVECGPSEALEPGEARIAVKVRRTTGSPIEGATVYVSDDPYAAEAKSDASGIARITDMVPGEYLILVTEGEVNEQAVLEVGDAEQCLVTFELGGDAAPAVEIIDETQGPAPTEPDAIERYRRSKQRGETLRGVGIGVITLGVALGVGSPLSWMVGPCGSDGATGGDCRGDLRTQLTVGFAVAGALTLAGGISMVAIGARRSKRAAAVSVVPAKGGGALSISGRF